MKIVLANQIHGDEDVVNVTEDECPFLGVLVYLLDERDRVVSPVTARVQVMGSVIAIVEREAVALDNC